MNTTEEVITLKDDSRASALVYCGTCGELEGSSYAKFCCDDDAAMITEGETEE